MSGRDLAIARGSAYPRGATATANGVNFSIFTRHGRRVWLVVYGNETEDMPLLEIELDADRHCTFFHWHVLVSGLPSGACYTWRVDGPAGTRANGWRFDASRELLDPRARAVSDAVWDRVRAERGLDAGSYRARVPDGASYDWGGDAPLGRDLCDSVIYEMHVGGFTRHPTSGVKAAGTFQGVIEKIPYLKALGITDVELLPVMAFDVQDVPKGARALGLSNYWGYSTVGFFAPHGGYCATNDPMREFRDMVKALHAAGIGVILDVVFNHTAEGGKDGPTIHFKGLDNPIYYHLEPDDRRTYRDFTGVGNSVNCNHPIVANFIRQCVDYWVREMHVDGFRFDLASVLARGEDGDIDPHAPVLWAIELSEATAGSHLIAEAWDAVGAYNVGNFPGHRWACWNDQYRDAVRRALRGADYSIPELATRIAGSSDVFEGTSATPSSGINFVTAHDGFTLNDLVSYDRKHNAGNGEDDRDGHHGNYSWNCGVEGPTDDPSITALRRRQVRNAMAILMLSQGTPMMLFGDEVLRSQQGNNNAYCQDNDIGWFDWRLVRTNADMLRFTREMIALRRRHRSLRRTRFFDHGDSAIRWHGEELDEPRWHDATSRVLAFTLEPQDDDEAELHVMINLSDETHGFAVPAPRNRAPWQRAVDTALDPPDDVAPPGQQPEAGGDRFDVRSHSLVVLEAWPA